MQDDLFPAASCLQFSIELGEIETNLQRVQAFLEAQPPVPGTLVVLPEIWATGFDYPRTEELGQRTPEILAWMQETSKKGGFFLAGSLTNPTLEAPRPFNTLFLIGPEGMLGSVSKLHLFRFWQEDNHYAAGKTAPLLASPYGVIGGLVCYDLRFPEVARRQVFAGARLLIVSAQWPLSRLDHWQTLLRARAIENQCYIVACNGCGTTGAMEMAGHSMIIGPDGQILAQAGQDPTLITSPLDAAVVDRQRNRFFPAGERAWTGQNKEKIVSLDRLQDELMRISRHGCRFSLVTGNFSRFEADQIEQLEQARSQADGLVVGVLHNGGALPGSESQAQQARILAALGCVDFVVSYTKDEQTQLEQLFAQPVHTTL
jgi:predicted amidohydrolase